MTAASCQALPGHPPFPRYGRRAAGAVNIGERQILSEEPAVLIAAAARALRGRAYPAAP